MYAEQVVLDIRKKSALFYVTLRSILKHHVLRFLTRLQQLIVQTVHLEYTSFSALTNYVSSLAVREVGTANRSRPEITQSHNAIAMIAATRGPA